MRLVFGLPQFRACSVLSHGSPAELVGTGRALWSQYKEGMGAQPARWSWGATLRLAHYPSDLRLLGAASKLDAPAATQRLSNPLF